MPLTLSSGQLRLREHVDDAAATVDPADMWGAPPALETLAALRARVLSDQVVTTDPRVGRDLAIPSIPATYVELQELLFPVTKVVEVVVAVEHLLCTKVTIYDPPEAVAGARKWHVTYGALTHLALGRAIEIGDECAPTILSGSSAITMGGGSNHRTLASFLWGEATLHHDRGLIKIVQDEPDMALWRACESLEIACPRDALRLGIYIPYNVESAKEARERIMALSTQAGCDEAFRSALIKRSQLVPQHGRGMVTLEELEGIASPRPARRLSQYPPPASRKRIRRPWRSNR
jgi:hypothetical protein